jgi:hypothetical protein
MSAREQRSRCWESRPHLWLGERGNGFSGKIMDADWADNVSNALLTAIRKGQSQPVADLIGLSHSLALETARTLPRVPGKLLQYGSLVQSRLGSLATLCASYGLGKEWPFPHPDLAVPRSRRQGLFRGQAVL